MQARSTYPFEDITIYECLDVRHSGTEVWKDYGGGCAVSGALKEYFVTIAYCHVQYNGGCDI